MIMISNLSIYDFLSTYLCVKFHCALERTRKKKRKMREHVEKRKWVISASSIIIFKPMTHLYSVLVRELSSKKTKN